MPNPHDRHNPKMMWLMMIFCAVPLLILLIGGNIRSGFNWFAIAAVGVFIAGHVWLMRKGHHGAEHRDNDEHQAPMAEKEETASHNQSQEHKKKCCH